MYLLSVLKLILPRGTKYLQVCEDSGRDTRKIKTLLEGSLEGYKHDP